MFSFVRNLFKKKLFIKADPLFFEYNRHTVNVWGDAIRIDRQPGDGTISGHGFTSYKKPEVGDLFYVEMQSGKTAVFVFVNVDYMRDPKDMYLYDAVFHKYSEIEGKA